MGEFKPHKTFIGKESAAFLNLLKEERKSFYPEDTRGKRALRRGSGWGRVEELVLPIVRFIRFQDCSPSAIVPGLDSPPPPPLKYHSF